jgi:outer membrane protein OmpA-like peptidoglycan-associated protein
MPKKLIIAIIAVISLYSYIFAGNFGTNTAEFLKINPEAAPAGMGEAYIAIAEGTNALQYNPAGLAIMDRGEATATHLWWFQQINMEHVAAGFPLAYGFGVGASVLWINYGSFDSTGGVMPPVDVQNGVINIGVGKSFGDNIHLGVNFRGLYEDFMGSASLGFSSDAGALIYLGSRNFTFGITAKNMGFLSGTEDSLPVEIGAGLGFRLFNGTFDYLNADVDVSKILNTDNVYVGAGAEYYLFQAVALRLGFRYNNAVEAQKFSFSDISKLVELSAGAGINFNDTVAFDYSFTPMGDLSPTHRFTLKVKFGDSWYEKKMSEKNVKVEPKAIEVPQVSVQDGMIKSVSFKPNVPDGNVKEWTLAIKTSDGKIVKTFSGVGEVPKTLNWDGIDSNGKISKADTNFVFDFKAKNDSGQIIKTIGHIVQPRKFDFLKDEDKRFVPLKGEEMLVAPVTLLVSPDAEERRQVPFLMVNNKIKKVKDWEFQVFDKNKTLLKTFSGQDMIPSYLVWDGKDSFGNYVTDLKDCQYILNINGTDGKKASIKDRQVIRDAFVITSKARKLKMAKRIFFESNSTDIDPEMMPKLDELASEIAQYRNVQIYIQGHSSKEGENDYNLKLSQDRAKTVLRYLVEKYRISPLSVTTVGYGSAVPLDNSGTEEGKMRNRRVEIIIIGEKE